MLKFWINSLLIMLNDTPALHSRNFWSIIAVICLINHCWLVSLLKCDLSCWFEWVGLLSCRVWYSTCRSSCIDWENAWMSRIVWYTFGRSLVCLTVQTSLRLLSMLVVSKAWTFNSSSKITILATIPLSLNLCLAWHVLQISSIYTILFGIVSRNAWLSTLKILTWTIRRVRIWKIFLKSIFKQQLSPLFINLVVGGVLTNLVICIIDLVIC